MNRVQDPNTAYAKIKVAVSGVAPSPRLLHLAQNSFAANRLQSSIASGQANDSESAHLEPLSISTTSLGGWYDTLALRLALHPSSGWMATQVLSYSQIMALALRQQRDIVQAREIATTLCLTNDAFTADSHEFLIAPFLRWCGEHDLAVPLMVVEEALKHPGVVSEQLIVVAIEHLHPLVQKLIQNCSHDCIELVDSPFSVEEGELLVAEAQATDFDLKAISQYIEAEKVVAVAASSRADVAMLVERLHSQIWLSEARGDDRWTFPEYSGGAPSRQTAMFVELLEDCVTQATREAIAQRLSRAEPEFASETVAAHGEEIDANTHISRLLEAISSSEDTSAESWSLIVADLWRAYSVGNATDMGRHTSQSVNSLQNALLQIRRLDCGDAQWKPRELLELFRSSVYGLSSPLVQLGNNFFVGTSQELLGMPCDLLLLTETSQASESRVQDELMMQECAWMAKRMYGTKLGRLDQSHPSTGDPAKPVTVLDREVEVPSTDEAVRVDLVKFWKLVGDEAVRFDHLATFRWASSSGSDQRFVRPPVASQRVTHNSLASAPAATGDEVELWSELPVGMHGVARLLHDRTRNAIEAALTQFDVGHSVDSLMSCMGRWRVGNIDLLFPPLLRLADEDPQCTFIAMEGDGGSSDAIGAIQTLKMSPNRVSAAAVCTVALQYDLEVMRVIFPNLGGGKAKQEEWEVCPEEARDILADIGAQVTAQLSLHSSEMMGRG